MNPSSCFAMVIQTDELDAGYLEACACRGVDPTHYRLILMAGVNEAGSGFTTLSGGRVPFMVSCHDCDATGVWDGEFLPGSLSAEHSVEIRGDVYGYPDHELLVGAYDNPWQAFGGWTNWANDRDGKGPDGKAL